MILKNEDKFENEYSHMTLEELLDNSMDYPHL